jgi:hypothetical protein
MQRVRSGSKENERNVQAAASTATAVDKLGMVLDRKRASFARAVTAGIRIVSMLARSAQL